MFLQPDVHGTSTVVTLMHCASYHPHISVVMSWVVGQQGMVFWSSYHEPWASTLADPTYHERIIGIIGYHSAILHGNHFQVSSSASQPFSTPWKTRWNSRADKGGFVFEPSTPPTPIVALARHFSPKIVYSDVD